MNASALVCSVLGAAQCCSCQQCEQANKRSASRHSVHIAQSVSFVMSTRDLQLGAMFEIRTSKDFGVDVQPQSGDRAAISADNKRHGSNNNNNNTQRTSAHMNDRDRWDELSPVGAMRKTRSATESYRGHKSSSHGDALSGASTLETSESSQRPYTATAATSPTNLSANASARKKKAPAKKPTDSTTSLRPRSAGLDGWGDFDTDRLLQDDFALADALDEGDDALLAPDDPVSVAVAVTTTDPDPERVARPRRIRHSAPATTVHNPVEDFPPAATDSARARNSREQPRPATHVLRQRPLAVVEFGSTQPTKSKGSGSSTPSRISVFKGRVHPPTGGGPPPTAPATAQPTQQPSRLPRLLPPTSLSQSQLEPLVSPTPLFGAMFPDAHDTRAVAFARFRHLWSLMSSRSSSACSAPASPSHASDLAQCKSPFECSMTLMKLCKAVGITSFSSSSASTSALALWSSKARGVDFPSFCAVAVQHAIQPAIAHFHADASIDTYVEALDRILEHVVAPCNAATPTQSPSPENNRSAGGECEPRLKELAEIEPLYPPWRTSTSSLTKTRNGAKSSADGLTDAPLEHHRTRHESALVFPSRRELTLTLPADAEAKATHSENIRRKVQLHKSWQPRSVLVTTSASIAALQAVRDSSAAALAPLALRATSPVRTNNAIAAPGDARCGSGAHALAPPPSAAAVATSDELATTDNNDDDDSGEGDSPQFQATDTDESAPEADVVLVCGACVTQDAVVWCASCFSVFCVACWQRIHALGVDLSSVHESSLASSVLAPTAKQLRPHVSSSDSNAALAPPPLAMLYLPTKALVPGKLAKGACSAWNKRSHEQQLDDAPDARAAAAPVAQLSVSSCAILPALAPAPSQSLLHEKERVAHESTSNLVQALMLGAAPLGSLSKTSASKAAAIAPRVYVDPKRRTKLQPAPIVLDPAQLLAPEAVSNLAPHPRRR